MKQMNIASILTAKRRERKITQEELAAHVGVSKASVSKWETGNSYPDISHLPVIASYFDISIDQLMNYSPQLSEGEIERIYTKLATDFASKPFEEVIAECDSVAKRYYSCYRLVMFIAQLYLNHAPMANTPQRKEEIYQLAITYCEHILQNCRDINFLREITLLQVICYMQLGNAEKMLEILGDEDGHPAQPGYGQLLSQAHQMLGNTDKAHEVEQTELLQNLMLVYDGLISYTRINYGNYNVAKISYQRAEALEEIFSMRRLNANLTGNLYALGAHLHNSAGERKKALEALEKYVDVCVNGFFPYAIRGDEFFDRVDVYIAKISENVPLPRSEAVVKESMLKDVLMDPAFDNLRDDPKYKTLEQKLKYFVSK